MGFAAAVAGALALFPQFALYPQDVLLKDELLSVPMTVAYEGFVPLRAVRSECVVEFAVNANSNVVANSMLAEREMSDWMMPGDEFTTGCFSRNSPPVIQMPDILRAEISIYIHFKAPFLPFLYTKHFAFGTEMTSSGVVRWMRIGPQDR